MPLLRSSQILLFQLLQALRSYETKIGILAQSLPTDFTEVKARLSQHDGLLIAPVTSVGAIARKLHY